MGKPIDEPMTSQPIGFFDTAEITLYICVGKIDQDFNSMVGCLQQDLSKFWSTMEKRTNRSIQCGWALDIETDMRVDSNCLPIRVSVYYHTAILYHYLHNVVLSPTTWQRLS